MNRTKRSWWEFKPFRTLFGFASISTAVLSAIAVLMFHKREIDIRSEDYYKEAMKMWKESSSAKFLIGEPISVKYVQIFNKKNSITDKEARFLIPFKGQNYDGNLNVNASFKDKEWIMNELSLELNQDLADKKFIVYRSEELKKQTAEKGVCDLFCQVLF